MNPNTHKLCKKCKSEYPHYNSGFTKCNNCPGKIINQEKKENVLNRRLYQVEQKGEIRSERKGKNLYRLTSSKPEKEIGKLAHETRSNEAKALHTLSGREGKRIRKVSDKQKTINSQLASLKKARIERLGTSCEACGIHCNVQYSHHVPRSLRGDLECDPDNACLLCWQCHFRFEHLLEPKEVLKFKNLEAILDYLWNNDKKRYYHVTDILKIEQLT